MQEAFVIWRVGPAARRSPRPVARTRRRPLEWVTPGDDGPVPAGEVVELGVTTPDPDAVAIEFLVDGAPIAT